MPASGRSSVARIRTKADVVALMQDAILGDILIPDLDVPAGWREAIAVVARRTRQVLIAYPWSLTELNEAPLGPNAMRHFEQSLAATASTGLPTRARLALIAAVDDYVAGNALHSVESLARARIAETDPDMVAAAVAYGTALAQAGDFPQLAALYGEGTGTQGAEPAPPPMTEDALASQFERGLQSLLDGIAVRLSIQ